MHRRSDGSFRRVAQQLRREIPAERSRWSLHVCGGGQSVQQSSHPRGQGTDWPVGTVGRALSTNPRDSPPRWAERLHAASVPQAQPRPCGLGRHTRKRPVQASGSIQATTVRCARAIGPICLPATGNSRSRDGARGRSGASPASPRARRSPLRPSRSLRAPRVTGGRPRSLPPGAGQIVRHDAGAVLELQARPVRVGSDAFVLLPAGPERRRTPLDGHRSGASKVPPSPATVRQPSSSTRSDGLPSGKSPTRSAHTASASTSWFPGT